MNEETMCLQIIDSVRIATTLDTWVSRNRYHDNSNCRENINYTIIITQLCVYVIETVMVKFSKGSGFFDTKLLGFKTMIRVGLSFTT